MTIFAVTYLVECNFICVHTVTDHWYWVVAIYSTATCVLSMTMSCTGIWHYINSIGLCCSWVRVLGNGEAIKVNMILIDQQSPWLPCQLSIFPLTTTVSVNSGFIDIHKMYLGNFIAHICHLTSWTTEHIYRDLRCIIHL